MELKSDRITTNVAIQPDDTTARAIPAAHAVRLIGAFKLCLDPQGHPSSVRRLRSTGFAAYDAELAAGMQTWRYRPFFDEGRAIPVCTDLTFIYAPG